MNNQSIYGYRLTHEDGSKSRWQFINDNDVLLTISIRLKNGARQHFSEEVDFVYNWATNRGLKVEKCCFEIVGAGASSWEQIDFKPVILEG